MTFKRLMGVTSVTAIGFGFYSLTGPFLSAFFGAARRPEAVAGDVVWSGIGFMRMFGALLIGIGMLAWFTRTVTDVDARRHLSAGLFAANGAGFLMAIMQQTSIWDQRTGWLVVSVLLLLSVMSWSCRFYAERSFR